MGLNAEIWVLGEHPVEQVEKAEALSSPARTFRESYR